MRKVNLGPSFEDPTDAERYQHDIISILALTFYLVFGTIILWALSWGILWIFQLLGFFTVIFFDGGYRVTFGG